jgi:hypothetical protein
MYHDTCIIGSGYCPSTPMCGVALHASVHLAMNQKPPLQPLEKDYRLVPFYVLTRLVDLSRGRLVCMYLGKHMHVLNGEGYM